MNVAFFFLKSKYEVFTIRDELNNMAIFGKCLSDASKSK